MGTGSISVRFRDVPVVDERPCTIAGVFQEPFVDATRTKAILTAIGLGLLATLEGSGQVVIDMPAPKDRPVATGSAGEHQPPSLGAVALNRYAWTRAAPLYAYPSPPVVWPWFRYGYGYGFGFPWYGFGWGFGYGYHRFIGVAIFSAPYGPPGTILSAP